MESVELEDQLRTQLLTHYGELDDLAFPQESLLDQIPQDPNNPLNSAKVQLGKFLYHETKLGIENKIAEGSQTYSCASCHHVKAGFQSGLLQGIGEGGWGFGSSGEDRVPNPNYPLDSLDIQPIRTPTILNGAYQDVMLWNGQFGAKGTNAGTESQWTPGTPIATNLLGFEGLETQAIAGMSVHRQNLNSELIQNTDYKNLFDEAFPEIPEEERYTRITAGLAIAAFERTVMAYDSEFQKLVRGESHQMSDDELKGGLLFFGKANCYECHNGPALSSNSFFALGMNDLSGASVIGNIPDGTKLGRGGFTGNTADNYKFKTPPLYNLRDVQFFGHGGSFSSVREVVVYKNQGEKENSIVPDSQLASQFKPLNLTQEEIDQLVAFLENALYDANLDRYAPLETPLGSQCFPNSDEQSKADMNCN
jgi:cytochrome c peroxidase